MFLEIIKYILKLKQVNFIAISYRNVEFFPIQVTIQKTHTLGKGTMKVQFNDFSFNVSAFVKNKQTNKPRSKTIFFKYNM